MQITLEPARIRPTDRILLLGLIALQTGDVSRDQRGAAFSLWVLNNQRALDRAPRRATCAWPIGLLRYH